MSDAHGGPPSTTSAVARFVAGTLVAVAVVVVGGYFALRSVATDEAERDTRQQVQAQGRLVESGGLTDGVLRGDPRALQRLDDVVLGQVLSPSIVRVKIWTRAGRILYSDEPALIGRRYALGEDERDLFRDGPAQAAASGRPAPRNPSERRGGQLLGAHPAIRPPNGTPVVFGI